jgi:hypothetical protein
MNNVFILPLVEIFSEPLQYLKHKRFAADIIDMDSKESWHTLLLMEGIK